MFERFTQRARRVVVLAQHEAGRLRHDHIDTEHLLLGMLREGEGVAFQALHACGVTLGGVREQVEGIVGYGDEQPGQQVPFTARSKRVLEASLREALDIGHNYIGTEHLLLGLLREHEGVASVSLTNLGVDREAVRREVFVRLGREGARRAEGLGPLGWAREALKRSFGRYPRGEARASFEKFTGRARKVVVLAQDEARHFNHNYIGTEHLLLGLLREDEGVAARALDQVGVHLDEVRERVEAIVGHGGEPAGPQAPFTPRVNEVFQLAVQESLQLDHDYVGPEHLLLGLVRESEGVEPGGVAARVLSDLGVDSDLIGREVIRHLPDREMGHDSLNEEEGDHDTTLFRARVTGVGGELAFPRPLAVTVDAEYAYRVPGSAGEGSTIQVGDVLDAVRSGLHEIEASSVESAVGALGVRLLAAFPEMIEATITVSGVPDPEEPTFSVSATFGR